MPGAPGTPEGRGGGKRAIGIAAGAGGLAVAAAKLEKSAQRIRDSITRTAVFDNKLQAIGQINDLTAERLSALRQKLIDTSAELGRSSDEMMKGILGPILASGIDDAIAEKMMRPLGRVAISQDAALGDIANTGIALAKNLKISVDQIEATFDGLAVAGKRGRFEISDMAKHFSAIASAAAEAGMQGKDAAYELAAALQVAREGARDPAQAANNMVNLLNKIQSPQTVAKFKKVGVDIKKAIADGAARGQSPLQTIILETKKALDADARLTVGNLFSDMQVRAALGPLVRDFDQFKDILRVTSAAAGTIGRDFAVMASTLQASLDRMEASIDRREKMWAKLVEPAAQMRSGFFTRLNNWLANLAERFPRLAGGIGAAGLAFGDLASVVSSAWPTLLAIASSMTIGKFLGLGRVIMGLGSAFGRFGLLILRGLSSAFQWLILLPAIFMKNFAKGVVPALVKELAPLGARLGPLFGRLVGPGLLAGMVALGPLLLRGLSLLLRLFMGPLGWALIAAQLAYSFRSELGTAISGITSWIQERFQSLFGGISLADIGAKLMQSLLDGLKSAAEGVTSWVSGFVERLKGLFSFSASPTIAPQGGGASSPAAIPQSYRPNGLTPAPSRQASVTFHNTFAVNGGADPEGAARRILAALDRQRQAGLYDGALA